MKCSYTPLPFGANLLCKWSILIGYKIDFYSDTYVAKQHKRMEYDVCSQLFKKCLSSSFNKRSNTLI